MHCTAVKNTVLGSMTQPLMLTDYDGHHKHSLRETSTYCLTAGHRSLLDFLLQQRITPRTDQLLEKKEKENIRKAIGLV